MIIYVCRDEFASYPGGEEYSIYYSKVKNEYKQTYKNKIIWSAGGSIDPELVTIRLDPVAAEKLGLKLKPGEGPVKYTISVKKSSAKRKNTNEPARKTTKRTRKG
jgi:hypothetical protein